MGTTMGSAANWRSQTCRAASDTRLRPVATPNQRTYLASSKKSRRFEPRRMTTASSRSADSTFGFVMSYAQPDRRAAVRCERCSDGSAGREELEATPLLRLDRARLHAVERDTRVARLPVDPVSEALHVRADASLRYVDVERDDRAGAGEVRAADRLRHVGLRAETRRRELDRARLVHDERERARVCPRDSLARLIRHEPADPDAADGDAEGDRCGSRRWWRRRWNRRLRGRRLRGGSRWRLGRLTRRARSGARGRGQTERGCKAEKCAGDKERCADGAGRRFHVSSVDTNIGVNMRGSFVTTASTPAASTRARSSGRSTVQATTAAPLACAARTHALVMTE